MLISFRHLCFQLFKPFIALHTHDHGPSSLQVAHHVAHEFTRPCGHVIHRSEFWVPRPNMELKAFLPASINEISLESALHLPIVNDHSHVTCVRQLMVLAPSVHDSFQDSGKKPASIAPPTMLFTKTSLPPIPIQPLVCRDLNLEFLSVKRPPRQAIPSVYGSTIRCTSPTDLLRPIVYGGSHFATAVMVSCTGSWAL